MLPENISFSHLHGALTAAGLLSFLSYPVAIDGPSALQDYATGRLRIDLRRGDVQRENARAAAEEQARIHPNGLRFHTHGTSLVAIQPVKGVIYSCVSADEEEWYGLFSTDRLHHTAAAVQSNPAVKLLLLNFDTPGGSVLGLRSAADAMLGLQQARPDLAVVGYSSRLCASAGMYLAAACQAFHAAPGAYIGSIGTIASLTDSTGFWEKLGIRTQFYIADSTLKDMGRGRIKPEHDAHMTALVEQYSAEFKSWMTTRRGLSAEAMQGQAWEARLAPAGMADSTAFVTVEEFLAAALGL